jgi:hypothetical protein
MCVTGYLLHRDGHVATSDLLADNRFPGLRGCETSVRAPLTVPLRVEDRVTGLLAVTRAAPGRQWTDDDIELLSIVAGNSAGSSSRPGCGWFGGGTGCCRLPSSLRGSWPTSRGSAPARRRPTTSRWWCRRRLPHEAQAALPA